MKYFLLSFYTHPEGKTNIKKRVERIIEAVDENIARNIAYDIVMTEGIPYEHQHLKLVPDNQVALIRKRLKDTRKLRYKSKSY